MNWRKVDLDPPYFQIPSAHHRQIRILAYFSGMRYAFAIATGLASTITPALADIGSSDALASLEAGIVCAADPIGSAPAPGTVAGVTHIIATEPEFVTNTRKVPAVLDIGFGVKAQSANPDGTDAVTVLVTHPKMGQTGATEQTFLTRISGSDPSLAFYQFDYAYELVLGTWQLTASAGDEVLYSVTFEVVDPTEIPELAGVCGFEELLS